MTGYMKPCWSCGVVDAPCTEPCFCARCIDADDYAQWRRDNPRAYAMWMARNVEDEDSAIQWYERAGDLEDYG